MQSVYQKVGRTSTMRFRQTLIMSLVKIRPCFYQVGVKKKKKILGVPVAQWVKNPTQYL